MRKRRGEPSVWAKGAVSLGVVEKGLSRQLTQHLEHTHVTQIHLGVHRRRCALYLMSGFRRGLRRCAVRLRSIRISDAGDYVFETLTPAERNQLIALFTRAIERDANDAVAFHYRGFVYASTDEQERAIADYSKAIEIDPMYVAAWRSASHRVAQDRTM